ncbi:MAG: hypothetical protein HKO03_07410, partial [Acidimicrobiia bacterium]|nr:hypothetical protein [Acidimicrobiia bacterium]
MNLVPVRNLFKEVSVIGVLALAALIVADMPAARAADLETGNSDVALFDQATGRWHLRYRDGSTNSFYYGTPGDVPLLGD